MHPLTDPAPDIRQFYFDCLAALDAAGVPFMVGGGYAMLHHAGITRDTKDLDLFIRPDDRDPAVAALAAAGYRTEITWPHFLCKAIAPFGSFVDLLHNSANGLCPVDDLWLTSAARGAFLGRPALIVPAEEQLWQKAFVQDRDRFDGADVNHLILHRGRTMNWKRLLHRFAGHEPVLLGHLSFFAYAFPADRDAVPAWVYADLISAAGVAQPQPTPACHGTFLSKTQYTPDITTGPYTDARLQPTGPLTPENIDSLNAA